MLDLAQLGAANCLVQLGRTAEARDVLARLLASQPGQPEALRALGRIELEAGNYPRAVELLRQAQEQQPHDDETLHSLASALRGVGNVDEARRVSAEFERVRKANAEIARLAALIAREPGDVEARYQVGNLLLGIGMPTEALIWFKSVLQFEPGHSGAREAIESSRAVNQGAGRSSAPHDHGDE